MTSRFRPFATALFFAFSFAFSATAAPFAAPVVSTERGTVSVGLLTPATGTLATPGIDVGDGFKYYLATHGDRLAGFRVDLHEGDEGDKVDAGLAGAKELVETDKSNVIVGLANSDVAYGVADYLAQQKVPTIVTVAGADQLTQSRANPYLFRVTNTNSQVTMPLGDYTCQTMKKKTAALIAVDYSFGYEAAGGFARTFTDDGCRVVEELYVPPDTTDFAPYVARLDRSAAVVFAAFSGADAPHFLSAYRDAGIKMPLVAHGALTDEALLGAERSNAYGIITALQYAATMPGKANTSFRMGFESLQHKPVSRYVENGYVAAQALDDALAKLPSGPVKSDALAAALRGVQFDAPHGHFRFDDRRAAVIDVLIRQVREFGGKPRNSILKTYPAVSQFWRYGAARYGTFKSYIDLKGTWAKGPQPAASASPAQAAGTASPAGTATPSPANKGS